MDLTYRSENEHALNLREFAIRNDHPHWDAPGTVSNGTMSEAFDAFLGSFTILELLSITSTNTTQCHLIVQTESLRPHGSILKVLVLDYWRHEGGFREENGAVEDVMDRMRWIVDECPNLVEVGCTTNPSVGPITSLC